MKKYTKEEAIAVVVQCAERYRDELDGRNLLFICMDKHKRTSAIECSFHGNNYLHLTGLKANRSETDDDSPESKLYANDFYQKCLSHKLSPLDFTFAEDGTTHLKLEALPGVLCKNLNASMIGNYNSSRPRLVTEKLVGGIRACMGFVFDKKLVEYVPNTVLQDDMRNLVTADSVRVVAVYRKFADDERYEELTYKAKKVDLSQIRYPDDFLYLQTT
jgi:hypothetical protein